MSQNPVVSVRPAPEIYAIKLFDEIRFEAAAPTIGQVACEYIANKSSIWGVHAEATTKSIIRKHVISTLGSRRVDELTTADVQKFVDNLVDRNFSSSLLNKTIGHLRAILDHAQESGIIRRNPVRGLAAKIDFKSRKQKSERYLSLDDCRMLLTCLAGRDRLILRLFVQLGLRPEELFALRCNDIEGDFLRIDELFTMGQISAVTVGRNPLRVYVPPDLMRELRSWVTSECRDGRDWLFPASNSNRGELDCPLSQRSYRLQVLKPAAEKAGIQNLDMLTLRRTCAVHFGQRASAADLMMHMRHSDRLVSARPAPETVTESLREAAAEFEAALLRRLPSSVKRSRSTSRKG